MASWTLHRLADVTLHQLVVETQPGIGTMLHRHKKHAQQFGVDFRRQADRETITPPFL